MKEVVQFLSQVRVELAKVIWPKFDEWIGSTIVVLVLIALFSIYLFFIDSMFSRSMEMVLYYQGLR